MLRIVLPIETLCSIYEQSNDDKTEQVRELIRFFHEMYCCIDDNDDVIVGSFWM